MSTLISLISSAACSEAESPSSPEAEAGASGAASFGGAGGAGGASGQAGVAGASAGVSAALAGAGSGSGGLSAAGSSGSATGGAVSSGGASGAAGSGVSGGGANGGATGLVSPPGFFTDGFLTRAPWQGYVFTIVDTLGSTVSPVCDTAGCTPAWGAQPCAKGTVAKNAASGSFAGIAFHANDPVGGPRGVWLATGEGIFVSVSNPPAGARLQLQQKAASNDTRYCAPLPAGGTGLIPFTSLKTYCWGDAAHPSKAITAGTDVHEVTVVVPGSSTADQPFDFCVVDIQPR